MQKIKAVFSILVLIFPLVLAPVLMSTAALAQCTWIEGLSVVQAFNSPRDHGWFTSWDPRFDEDWMRHYSGIGLERCSLGEQGASAASDSEPSVRPGINNAIRNDTCPSAYDIDCCATCRLPVEGCISFGGGGLAPGPECCR